MSFDPAIYSPPRSRSRTIRDKPCSWCAGTGFEGQQELDGRLVRTRTCPRCDGDGVIYAPPQAAVRLNIGQDRRKRVAITRKILGLFKEAGIPVELRETDYNPDESESWSEPSERLAFVTTPCGTRYRLYWACPITADIAGWLLSDKQVQYEAGPHCPSCNGTGSIDSGGTTPWGHPIDQPCGCLERCERVWSKQEIVRFLQQWKQDSKLREHFRNLKRLALSHNHTEQVIFGAGYQPWTKPWIEEARSMRSLWQSRPEEVRAKRVGEAPSVFTRYG